MKVSKCILGAAVLAALFSFGQTRSGLPGELTGPASVVVHVRDTSGTPLQVSATVKIIGFVNDGGELSRNTVEAGNVTFTNLKVGQYTVEVRATGYEDAKDEFSIYGFDQSHCFVTMKVAGSSGSTTKDVKPAFPALNGRSRKELDLAITALRANNLPESAKHLEYVLKHAGENPDVQYVAALQCLRSTDVNNARLHLESAIRVYPNHAASRLELAELHLRRNDAAAALPHLEALAVLEPNSWRAHWLLAEALLRAKSDAVGARSHALRAVELGKEQASQAVVTLAVAELLGGEKDGARRRLEQFVQEHPSDVEVPRVRQILASNELAVAKVKPVSLPVEPPPLPPDFLARLPRNIDAAVPPVDAGVTCALPEVLKGAATRAAEFGDALERFTAREAIVHEELDPAGGARHTDQRAFSYSAALHHLANGQLGVSEMRNGDLAVGFSNDFSVALAAKGVPAVGIIFHPSYSTDFQFSCEGLGQWHGRPAWQLRFEQRADRPARIHEWVVDGQTYPVLLKGRAWLSAGTFHILRVETDLVGPIAPIRLEMQHMAIDYAPVRSASGKRELWLPQSAEIVSRFRGRAFRQTHEFSDFLLFSVDTDEKIKSATTK